MATSFGTTDPKALTRREIEVLRHVADGLDNEEIAACLHVSVHTVRKQVESLRMKLGAHNKAHAVNLGHLAGYLPEEDKR